MRVSASTVHAQHANSFHILTAISRRFQGQSLSQRQNEPRVPLQKTIVVLGPQDAGKATTVGNMIYKVLPKLDISTIPSVEFEECGGIDLATMEAFQRHGVQNYHQVLPALRARDALPSFSTPQCEIVVLDEAGADVSRADCALLVIAADAAVPSPPHGFERWQTILGGAGEVIVLVNKMDNVAWSEARFNTVLEDTMTRLKEVGVHITSVTTIPISGLHGDNLIEPSPKSPWYSGRGAEKEGEGRASRTLLEAIDSCRASPRKGTGG